MLGLNVTHFTRTLYWQLQRQKIQLQNEMDAKVQETKNNVSTVGGIVMSIALSNAPTNTYSVGVRPRLNVELFMRWVKLMKGWTSGSVKFVWMSLDRLTRSIRLLQTDRTSEDLLRDKRPFSHATNWTNELNIWMTKYIYPRSGENLLKLLFGLIQLIGSTRPKFDVWPNRRSALNFGRPKWESTLTSHLGQNVGLGEG